MALFSKVECDHMPQTITDPRADRCEECGSGFNLRVCADCGHVGCCESQLGHNRSHAMESGHPVILSMPVGRGSFTWCYSCRSYV